jgi:hypothetical protein
MAATQETRTTTRRRSTPKEEPETARRKTTRKRPAAEESAEEEHRTATVPVPVITPHVTVHKVHVPTPRRLPSGHEVVDAGKAVTSVLPPPDRLAYYAGLGALAVFGVMEWPVAAAIGVGVAVAKRAGGPGEQRPEEQKAKQEEPQQEKKEEKAEKEE